LFNHKIQIFLRCLHLEKLLKEERNKNSQLYAKSMEVVRKYNQELKLLKNRDNDQISNSKTGSSNNGKINTISIHTQTNSDEYNISKGSKLDKNVEHISKDYSLIIKELVNMKQILNTNDNNANSAGISLDSINIQTLLGEIDLLIKHQNKNFNTLKFDMKSSRDQNSKLNNEVNCLKEAKSKLETLYKIKCKSDLNKSAQIKKLELNYEAELSKLRNEHNYDIVAYLKNKLSYKESLIVEYYHQLVNISDLIKNCTHSTSEFLAASNCCENNNLNNALLKIKKIIDNFIETQEKKQNDTIIVNSLINDDLNLNLNNIYKTIPINLVSNNNSDSKAIKIKTQEIINNSIIYTVTFFIFIK
jgi:hypothetical protein